MGRLICWLTLVASLIGVVPDVRAELSVWTAVDTKRILRSAPPGTETGVRLQSARNEWVSFQILLRATESTRRIRVVPGDLVESGGQRLRGDDARLYRAHQLELTNGTLRNDKFQHDWYPDALIPVRHPVTRQPLQDGRFVAQPFDLPAQQTHGFWIDIYVPASCAATTYQGTYRIETASGVARSIAVQLTVWPFTLPARPALRTALGSPAQRMRSYYRERASVGKDTEPTDWDAVESQCAELLERHRINATPPTGVLHLQRQTDGTFTMSDVQVHALRKFIDRYHVNALQVPHPRTVVKDPITERVTLLAWLHGWDQTIAQLQRPDVVFFTYLRDEPNDKAAYEYVQKWGRAIGAAKSVIKVLVVEQTWSQQEAWGDLYGAVDIWCPLFSLFRPESAARRQAAGETIWTYTALCQGRPTPWWHIDYPLLNYRVPAWIAWRYRIRGLLYWGGLSYWRAVEDPWVDPATYHGSGTLQHGKAGRVYNGEGSLVYPGRAVGYDGIVPSMRLKALRDAIEDYEYLALLERAGQAEAAQQVVLPLATSWSQWEPDPARYTAIRNKLAQLIIAAQQSDRK